ncbi:hypothetical protein BN137_281 [Cronobacter condimenti 1330]|uniref:Uncharacterized protein n=1 Tax=Cronobacter condimenti 1330 TaxID=1073999 RepID=K7ZXG7_9ENTR|nr:hypothetical protein BN137_281 [Cronobacter condimenti 1330]
MITLARPPGLDIKNIDVKLTKPDNALNYFAEKYPLHLAD